jgi:hypothetical protein
MNRPTLFAAFIVCLLLISAAVLLARNSAALPVGDDLWPTRGWATAHPSSVGLDEQVLLRRIAYEDAIGESSRAV